MKKALIGFGGHAREVMAQMGKNLVCFVDDEFVVEGTKPISEFNPKKYKVMIAIANPQIRKQILSKLPKNTKFFSWIHPTSLILNNVKIGEGSFVGAYSIITTNIKIGNHCILNRMNQIGHDCVIGDFFSAMPGSIVSGNVNIQDSVYLGNNSCIKENITIHNDTTIGMNASVVKNIIESGTYVGVPSKKIK
jgi:sugar O-acyltransferase (sialic acid O-acetyltransferase NeuD family)